MNAQILAHADLIPDPLFSLPVSQQEPPAPDQNSFQVGMKLEAVDRKNPHFICPATVGALRGVEVLVTFDGWRGAFDYYCRYDSRDIFPVGWCNLTGDNLQPPGTKGLDLNSRREILWKRWSLVCLFFFKFLFIQTTKKKKNHCTLSCQCASSEGLVTFCQIGVVSDYFCSDLRAVRKGARI